MMYNRCGMFHHAAWRWVTTALLGVFVSVFPRPVLAQDGSEAAVEVDFRQAANENPILGDANWINSILQANKSVYLEGMSVPQRLIFIDIVPTTGDLHSLDFNHQASKGNTPGDPHAYDYLTSWAQAVAAADAIAPGQGLLVNLFSQACGPSISATAGAVCNTIRTGPNCLDVTVPDAMGSLLGDNIAASVTAYESNFGDRTIRICGSDPMNSASLAFNGYSGGADEAALYTLTWNSSSVDVVIEMAGHLSVGPDNGGGAGIGYGAGVGASAISGGPYHYRLKTLDGLSLGSKDNQIKGADILIPFCLENTCDDGIACTDDVCDEENDLCIHTPDNSVCGDGEPCTDDVCDTALGCVHTDNNANLCDDSDACTVNDRCMAGTCISDPVDCSAFETQCTTSSCDPGGAEGNCDTVTNKANFTPCVDGLFCTVDDDCFEGVCSGDPRDCSDGVICTIDDCDEDLNICTHTVSNIACQNDDFCDGMETCDAELDCQPGTDPCTGSQVCDETNDQCVGCVVAGDCVDDGIACTVEDCVDNTCESNPDNSLCDDSNICTDDVCDPIEGCIHTPIFPAICDDSDVCSDDACNVTTGLCEHTAIVCNDSDLCTDDSCDPVTGCAHTPIDPATCNDNDVCTIDDCDPDTGCTHTSIPPCDDSDECTDDRCDTVLGCVHTPIDPATCDDSDACTIDDCDVVLGCTHTPIAPCDDNDRCTRDACDAVTGCTHTPIDPAECNDDIACTVDSCDPEIGCVNEPDNTLCDDTNACTDDVCNPNTGLCEHTSNNDCDDSNACTDDECIAATGLCEHTSNIDCDDNNVCTDDSCNATSGLCEHAAGLNCNDNSDCTADRCDPIQGCINDPDDTLCGDNNACTIDECDGSVGTGCKNTLINVASVCNDNDGCTIDTCEPATGCVNTGVCGACCDEDSGDCVDDVLPADCNEPLKFRPGQSCSTVVCGSVPTVSQWGMIAMLLLLLAGAKIYFGSRRKATVRS